MPPAYEVLLLNTAVPQIQAAQAGDTYVCPRDIQITADLDVTGNTILGDASTDTVRVNGYMGVGGAANGGISVYARNTALTGTSQVGFQSQITATSAATTGVYGFYVAYSTEAAAFTVGNAYGVRVANLSLGAGSSATNQHGLHIADLTSATNNYGITSLVSSGTNKWNIYASGTAANYFAGNVGIGTNSPQTQLELSSNNGAGTALNILRFNDADTTSLPDQPTGKIEFYINDATAGGTGVASYIMGHAVNTAGGGYLTFATSPNGATGAIERLRIEFHGGLITKPAANGHAVFNEDGVDADFRVESDTSTHALFVDAGNSRVGVGESTPLGTLHTSFTNSGTYASSSASITTPAGTEFIVQNTSSTTGSGSFLSLRAANGAGTVNYAYVGAVSNAGSHSPEIVFGQRNGATAYAERLRITSVGNISIGGTANRATTVGSAALNIFDGTAPVGTLANGISIYSSSGEAYVMDAAGNATLFSPHDAETNEWIFKSKHTPTGKVLKIDVERLLKFVNDHFGLDAVHEFVED